MDGNIGIDLEAQFHVCAVNTKHRDFEQAMKPVSPADHDRLTILPR
jgi:hypothetical protein